MEAMEKIAVELREISDQIGEDIYEKTVRAMEAADEFRERQQEAAAQIRELKERYQELSYRRSRTFERLNAAFPTMRPRRYKEHLAVIRRRMNERFHRL